MMGLGLRIVVDRCSGRSWWHGGSGAEFQWWLKCLLGLLGGSGGFAWCFRRWHYDVVVVGYVVDSGWWLLVVLLMVDQWVVVLLMVD